MEQQLATQLYTHVRPGNLAITPRSRSNSSKPQILAMYAAVVYFAHGYLGIAPDQLGCGQAALMVGLPQAPSVYDPEHHPHRTLARAKPTSYTDSSPPGTSPKAAAACAASPLFTRHIRP